MSTLTLSWNANGSIESFSVFKGTAPLDPNNLPKAIATGLTEKQFVDTDVIDGVTYYYRVASIAGKQQKLSDEAVIIAQGTTLKANIFNDLAVGSALPYANISVVVDESLSAEFTQQANQMQGKAQPNAQVTITIGD